MPEKKGKIYWLTGPPGAGKSTMCQLLGREKGFVYYEGDCMLSFINPFIPPDVENPSMAQQQQKGLKVSTLNSILREVIQFKTTT